MRILHIGSIVGLKLGLTFSRIVYSADQFRVNCKALIIVRNGASLSGLERADNCQSCHRVLLNIKGLLDLETRHAYTVHANISNDI